MFLLLDFTSLMHRLEAPVPKLKHKTGMLWRARRCIVMVVVTVLTHLS